MIKKVGEITFDNNKLDVYSSMNEPLFVGYEVAEMLGYEEVSEIIAFCERDQHMQLKADWRGLDASVRFITESGLYNVLSQSKTVAARKWRKVIHDKLIEARKQKNMDISEQFEEWADEMDDIYYDEDTDTLMRSVTIVGGDVVQVPANRVGA